jgi:site-specific DNA recombinase
MTTNKPHKPNVRCAVYTRKSTEEGLDQEFNTLDAQRDSAEAYIHSQAHEGWVCLPDRYDDGGFTGANMDRPALQQLLTDIQAGKVQAVVCYKLDRLSRSLLDFAKMMELFDRYRVSFVSVTQLFNTTTPMGRLVLHILLSFAQFERELISERTRDKIAAARRKGKWSGGMPLLGYDVDPRGSKLVVNKAEAVRVRAIFALYLRHQALLPVVAELERRGWRTKAWTTRRGRARGGKLFTRTNLYNLLTRVAYVGKVRYRNEVHKGEHTAIVEPVVWNQVQALLRRHGRREPERVAPAALLQGLLRCLPCNCRMSPTYVVGGAGKRYCYYVCSHAQRRGWQQCPSKSLSASAIERFVIDQVRALANDPDRLREMIADHSGDFTVEDPAGDAEGTAPPPLEAIRQPAWDMLSAEDKTAVVRGLVDRVSYDGAMGKVVVTFRPRGLRALATREEVS